MAHVTNLNHAVLWVRDVDRSARFYSDVLGFQVIERMASKAAFLRAKDSPQHHDLGLFAVGADAPQPPRGSVGLYHLAWQVPSIRDLAELHDKLAAAGSLVGSSDHGVSKSLYAHDPDGIEFEVMWLTPRESWGENEEQELKPLDLQRELAAWA